MDWGLGNPNKTAALIAILMVAVWSFAYLQKRLFWVALVLFSGLGVCLVHTFSRGGILAAFCGLLPLLIFIKTPWPRGRIVGVIVAFWVIIGASIYLQAHQRFGQGVVQEDRSISNRLDLWKYAPTMMVDAPAGWGIGKSGKAFMEWYQPLDRNEPYRTMVNSHLTWLVEFGWLGRFLYLVGWLFVFAICLPDRRSHWLAIPFGIWLTFFVSAIFSSVAEEPWIWVVPVLALLSAVGWRIKTACWPQPATWIFPPVAAASLLLLVPILWQGTEIQRTKSAVVVGEGTPSVWVVADEKVLGSGYARTLRAHWMGMNSICVGIVSDAKELPSLEDATLILTGMFTSAPSETDREKLAGAASILVVNPAVFPQEFGNLEDLDGKLTVAIGDFAQSPASIAWTRDLKAHRIAGVGDFIPDWPVKLLQEINTQP